MDQAARDSLAGGIHFLLVNRHSDGGWRDFLTPGGEASSWTTAYVGAALRSAGVKRDALVPTADALLAAQRSDGGWGYNEDVPSDADSTSWALLFLAGTSGHDVSCSRAGRCLVHHQRRRGGVATYASSGPIRQYTGLPRWVPFRGWCRPTAEVTAVAARALGMLRDDAMRRRSEAAWRYIRSRQNDDGSWRSYWWTSPHFATHQAAALARCEKDGDEALRRAAAWILRSQRPDGGWRVSAEAAMSAFATASAISILATAQLRRQMPVNRAVRALVGLQGADGGWPSEPILRIPAPPDVCVSGDDRWHPVRFGPGIVVADQHRIFTSATCVIALAHARHSARAER